MRALALAAAAAVLAACGEGAGSPDSGLSGIVKQGPVTPVCHVNVPCDAPAPGVTLLFERAGRTVGKAVTRKNGSYRVSLPPGRYSVRTTRKPFGTMPTPSAATVRRGRISRVDFSIDTGIR